MPKTLFFWLAAAAAVLAACAAPREPGATTRATTAAATRLPADIQSRASGLTWEARWLGDGLGLFTTQVLAREADGQGAAARNWLCAAYSHVDAARLANPQGAPAGDAALQAEWGALWWTALRDAISDAGLRDLLHVLETNHGRDPLTLEQVQAATDDVLRGDMSPYFAPWDAAESIADVPGLSFCP